MKVNIISTTLNLSGEVLSEKVIGKKKVREKDFLEAQTLLVTGHSTEELVQNFRERGESWQAKKS